MKFVKFYNEAVSQEGCASSSYGLTPRGYELLLSRGLKTDEEIREFLSPEISYNPFLLKGMDKLVARVNTAIKNKEKILIFGDYDVDGVSATAIMLKTMSVLGVKASFYLPNRYVDGYGLTNEVIDKIKKKYNPKLIITVDCGISCKDEVEYAKSLGIEIIVTDHHEIPEKLPEGIVVNAKLPDQEFPFDGLCGCGLAYKISQALIGIKAEEFLPIAAIATIADIVPLISENRTIVTRGLKLFEKYLPLGVRMLLKANKIGLNNMKASDISFKIAPKINASGRMGDATDSLLLYLETDPVKLKLLIEKIAKHNTRRQELCNKVYEDCEKALKKQNLSSVRTICLASKEWDQGILGIVCSRLVEKYSRPVFLFSLDKDGTLKGSGRSIMDINIHHVLSSLNDILDAYGGHTMAAGLTLKRSNYEEFVRRVNAYMFENISDDVFMPIAYYDQEITTDEITPALLADLDKLEPFGCGNPKPKFMIETEKIKLEPMRFCPQHANIIIDKKLTLTMFNFLSEQNKLNFSLRKSFIFELQGANKGVVSQFDGGRRLVSEIKEPAAIGEVSQLEFLTLNASEAKFQLFPKQKLLSYVTETAASAFGTCFVATNLQDYEDFVINYNQENIFNHEIFKDENAGFNTVLLSPVDINFCKNYNRIVFLSPLIDLSYVSKINKLSDAQVLLPIEKKNSINSFKMVNTSRENFGKIYKSVKSKSGKDFYDIIDMAKSLKVRLIDLKAALLVFSELGIMKLDNRNGLKAIILSNKKTNLTDSKIYNMLCLLRGVARGE